MLSEKLFEEVLIKPVQNGCNKLRIVSGYASSAMAFHHFENTENINQISIELIVGMCSQDGISLSNHRGFQHLTRIEYPDFFRCSYLVKNPPVHSKTYVWMKNEKPFKAYVGSANYTQNAFLMGQRETVCECDPISVDNYFSDLENATIYCEHIDAEEFIQIYNDKAYAKRKTQDVEEKPGQDDMFAKSKVLGLNHVKLSLLAKGGNIGSRSGLNWGQRPEERREPNQAYIPLKADISRSDFFLREILSLLY